MTRPWLVAAVIGIGTACCPIPVPRQVSVRPRFEVSVVDAAGAGVPGATVTLMRRIEAPPPDEEIARWTATTDPAGLAVFDALEATEGTYPLMMHGVVFYGWVACAESSLGAGSVSVPSTQAVMPPQAVRVVLTAGSTCPAPPP